MGLGAWKQIGGGKSNGMLGVSKKKTSTNGAKSPSQSGRDSQKSTRGAKASKQSPNGHKRKANRNNSPRGVEADMKRFRAEDDLRILTEAERIKESPDRVKLAKRIAVQQVEKAQEAVDIIQNKES